MIHQLSILSFSTTLILAVGFVAARPLIVANTPSTMFRHHKPPTSGENSNNGTSFSPGTCPADVVSCKSGTTNVNSCCVETPGGQIIQTQFWDSKPATGPLDSWTVHGLWPDNCASGDGTYSSEGCDASRNYPGIAEVLKQNGKADLVAWMNDYWVDINNDNEKFWAHEWNKHGTCMSTIAPSCLPSNATKGLDAAYYFQRATDMFKALPTYTFLSKAGITPDESKTYTLDELTTAIKPSFGYQVALGCKGSALNSISYYYNLKGTVVDGTFIAFDAPKAGSCPQTGIKYYPKTPSNGKN